MKLADLWEDFKEAERLMERIDDLLPGLVTTSNKIQNKTSFYREVKMFADAVILTNRHIEALLSAVETPTMRIKSMSTMDLGSAQTDEKETGRQRQSLSTFLRARTAHHPDGHKSGKVQNALEGNAAQLRRRQSSSNVGGGRASVSGGLRPPTLLPKVPE